MFTHISWSSYFITIAILSAGYYLVIGYLYYRNDVLQLISPKKVEINNDVTIQRHQSLAHLFSDEVQAFMQQAGKDQLGKEDILQSLQSLLNKYPALKDPAFRESIQNLIKFYCSIHLSDEELRLLWN